jgi:hypothetical protein
MEKQQSYVDTYVIKEIEGKKPALMRTVVQALTTIIVRDRGKNALKLYVTCICK